MSLRVLVCCGSGGVGKTTTSAALAMQAALCGQRVAAAELPSRLLRAVPPARLSSISIRMKRKSICRIFFKTLSCVPVLALSSVATGGMGQTLCTTQTYCLCLKAPAADVVLICTFMTHGIW